MYQYTSITLIFLTIPFCITAMDTEPDNLSWAQKTLTQLTLTEKIGQLFMVAAISDTTQNPGFLEHTPYTMDCDYIKHLISNYHVGGIIFLGLSNAEKQYTLTQEFQQLSSIPLLIGQDLEWGLQMRLRDTMQFPYALTLGAIQDNNLIYQLGKEIGRQCCAIGVHINFAPVADINTNPRNPVINHRSFGDNPKNVSQKTTAFAHGLHDASIIACAKHFPGHGDTDVDSHYDLPIIRHNTERLHAVELLTFKQLIANNIPAIMTAHIAVPALEKQTNVPASLSYDIVTGLLKNELGFNGLIITDGLGMQGVTKHYEPGHVELNALLAGNDILLCPVDVPRATELILQTIKNGQFSEKELDTRVLKILSAKEWVLTQKNFKKIMDTKYNHDALHTEHAYNLKQTLYQHAVTVVRNIPRDTTKPSTLIQIGCSEIQPFAQALCNAEPNTALHFCNPTNTDQSITNMIAQLPTDYPIIIALHGMNRLAREQYGITDAIQKIIKDIHTHNPNTLLVLFGNPYSGAFFDYLPGLICAYQDDSNAQITAADSIVGTLQAKGKLPVSI